MIAAKDLNNTFLIALLEPTGLICIVIRLDTTIFWNQIMDIKSKLISGQIARLIPSISEFLKERP